MYVPEYDFQKYVSHISTRNTFDIYLQEILPPYTHQKYIKYTYPKKTYCIYQKYFDIYLSIIASAYTPYVYLMKVYVGGIYAGSRDAHSHSLVG